MNVFSTAKMYYENELLYRVRYGDLFTVHFALDLAVETNFLKFYSAEFFQKEYRDEYKDHKGGTP